MAGAVVRTSEGGRRELLLARRSYPPEVAGLWELPGGKAQAGETLGEALVRELAEELEVSVDAGEQLGEHVVLRPGLTLVALWARLLSGRPRAVEHQALTWVDAGELAAMTDRGELVPADTAWVPELLAVLSAPPISPRSSS